MSFQVPLLDEAFRRGRPALVHRLRPAFQYASYAPGASEAGPRGSHRNMHPLPSNQRRQGQALHPTLTQATRPRSAQQKVHLSKVRLEELHPRQTGRPLQNQTSQVLAVQVSHVWIRPTNFITIFYPTHCRL